MDTQNHHRIVEFDERLNRKLDKLERDVMEGKQEKMYRDRVEYESNTVYSWTKTCI